MKSYHKEYIWRAETANRGHMAVFHERGHFALARSLSQMGRWSMDIIETNDSPLPLIAFAKSELLSLAGEWINNPANVGEWINNPTFGLHWRARAALTGRPYVRIMPVDDPDMPRWVLVLRTKDVEIIESNECWRPLVQWAMRELLPDAPSTFNP